MAKRVLSVGNCGYDHGNLTKALSQHFAVELQAAATAEEAVQAVGEQAFDLILVNRVFDTNGDSGIALIKKLKSSVKAPIMLISNYPEAQAEAVEAGAVPGFGKKVVGKPGLVAAVETYLK